MTWTTLDPPWETRPMQGDVDTAALWATSGGAWLTDPRVAVPDTLVRAIVDMVRWLDSRGSGLAGLVGADGVGVVGERAAITGATPASDVSCGGATRLFAAVDGWLAVSLARPDDIESIPAWLGVPVGDDPWATVGAALDTLHVREVVERASLLGLAVAAVGEVVDTRGVLVRRVGDHPGFEGVADLRHVVVADLASLWAGPLAGDVLARLGARVITIESVGRPDGARRVPDFFDALHGRSESVALAFDRPEGQRQLRQLLGAVDVVIEGSRPRALEQLGVDAMTMAASGPRVWASITAHGRDGPFAARIGYGDDAAAAGGLVGWVEGRPLFLADAITDPVAGLATAASIVHLLEGGGRWVVDVALARLGASLVPSGSDHEVWQGAPWRVERPRRRRDPGRSLPIGRDTAAVLEEFGIAP